MDGMKKAIVFGAGGFIGSHLVRRLKAEGYWVRGVDLKQPAFSATAADEFVEAIKLTLETTPPELAADAMNQGIVLAGGGALIRGLDTLITQETGMPVRIAPDPLDCVVHGTGRMLEMLHENPRIRRMLEKASKG